MSNFVPNEVKKIRTRDPIWFTDKVKRLLRKQNNLYRKFRNSGFKPEDTVIVDACRVECSQEIDDAKTA